MSELDPKNFLRIFNICTPKNIHSLGLPFKLPGSHSSKQTVEIHAAQMAFGRWLLPMKASTGCLWRKPTP
jgi:hypothetical protein